jgi:hypothetical protein
MGEIHALDYLQHFLLAMRKNYNLKCVFDVTNTMGHFENSFCCSVEWLGWIASMLDFFILHSFLVFTNVPSRSQLGFLWAQCTLVHKVLEKSVERVMCVYVWTTSCQQRNQEIHPPVNLLSHSKLHSHTFRVPKGAKQKHKNVLAANTFEQKHIFRVAAEEIWQRFDNVESGKQPNISPKILNISTFFVLMKYLS